MNIIWLGHGSFRIEIEDQVLLIDPWLTGNPMLDTDKARAACDGATQILVTHGHFDHTQDVADYSKDIGYLVSKGAVEGSAFNRGGTIQLGKVSVTLVPASHSSSIMDGDVPLYMGQECGFMIRGEGKCIYVSGDTDIMADMEWMGDYYKPDVGILSAGGHFTMDMKAAAYAAKRYFNFSTVIPAHYRTFPLLAQDAKPLVDGLPNVDVIEPQVLEPIKI